MYVCMDSVQHPGLAKLDIYFILFCDESTITNIEVQARSSRMWLFSYVWIVIAQLLSGGGVVMLLTHNTPRVSFAREGQGDVGERYETIGQTCPTDIITHTNTYSVPLGDYAKGET